MLALSTAIFVNIADIVQVADKSFDGISLKTFLVRVHSKLMGKVLNVSFQLSQLISAAVYRGLPCAAPILCGVENFSALA